ncbi:MAG: YkgJ family cysteine cluster protein [Desulfobacterales bacterium]
MTFDLEPYFEKYRSIVALADDAFERIRKDYSECVTCRLGCADCCHALFDLTLIEALYINRQLSGLSDQAYQRELLEKANRADRRIHKIKRSAQKAVKEGQGEEEVLIAMGEERVRCPLLNDKNQCKLYDHRPVVCRLYGVPLNIGGVARICSLTHFKSGVQYPTVHMEAIQRRLHALSAELVRDINSKYSGLADLLVPLSMALLTDYDDNYLGVESAEEKTPDQEGKGSEPHG